MIGENAYGIWLLVLLNSIIFIIFAFSFTKPKTKRDWSSLSAFSAFIVALFTEMYGFPLTIYLLSGWLTKKYPNMDIYSHDAGHLWQTLLGFKGNTHFNALHTLSIILIIAGFFLLSDSWKIIHKAQKEHKIAKTGPYKYLRHPQYLAFIIIMSGFLIQWPTLLTMLMFPILVFMYLRLASSEEKQALKEFGREYNNYANKTPAFIPNFKKIYKDIKFNKNERR